MAIAPKPKLQESDIAKLIEKGGSVAETKPEKEFTPFVLRIPTDIMPDIDASIKRRRPVRISRNQWIIEAIAEKLQREAANE